MATTQHIDEIASVYAASLLEVCDKQGGTALAESCSAELSALAEMIRADKRFAEFLKTPIIGSAARRASIDRIVKGKVSDLVHRFVMVIAAHGRAGRLADIADVVADIILAITMTIVIINYNQNMTIIMLRHMVTVQIMGMFMSAFVGMCVVR